MIWPVGFLLLLGCFSLLYLYSRSDLPVSWLFVSHSCCLVLLSVFCVLLGYRLAG